MVCLGILIERHNTHKTSLKVHEREEGEGNHGFSTTTTKKKNKR
jgi:hypothetical protein